MNHTLQPFVLHFIYFYIAFFLAYIKSLIENVLLYSQAKFFSVNRRKKNDWEERHDLKSLFLLFIFLFFFPLCLEGREKGKRIVVILSHAFLLDSTPFVMSFIFYTLTLFFLGGLRKPKVKTKSYKTYLWNNEIIMNIWSNLLKG